VVDNDEHASMVEIEEACCPEISAAAGVRPGIKVTKGMYPVILDK